MSKKILYMSSAKLTAFSIGLLLAVFCTIGMSFTPVEEEEIVETDTVTGEVTRTIRRAHKSGTCNDTKSNDYGNAIAVSKGGGTVTIANVSGGGSINAVYKGTTSSWGKTTGTTLPVTSNATANSGVKVEWICGEKDQTSGTEANHKHKFKWTATPSTGYKFDGWSTDGTNIDASITNSYEYEMVMDASTYNSSTGYSQTSPYKYTLYAHFSEKRKVTVTMPVTANGSYTYSCADGSGTVNTSTSGSVTTDEEITFTATAASGYKFFGWYTLSETTENYLSLSSTYTKGFSDNTTVYAKFIPTDAAVFTLKGTTQYYTDLSSAITAANAATGNAKVIVPIFNGTVSADSYTIPSGVTLLLPYDDAYTVKTTDPSHPYAAPGTPSVYRKLTLATGVTITVQSGGAISVSALSQGNQPYGGCVYGKYGQIDMQSGSTITLNSGANLYCWGYITGAGEITAKSGSKVYEDFQIACWRGGTAGSSSTFKNNEVFPLSQYYIQNIEAKLHLQSGASEYIWTAVSASSASQRPSSAIQLIGKTAGLFRITSGTLTKWFNYTDDRQMYELEGDMSIASMSMTFASIVEINSADYVLPLTNNMDITVKSGTLSCDQKIAILPGAKVTINEGANASFGSSSELYVYDKDNWGVYSYYTSAIKGAGYLCEANYSPSLSGIHGKRLYSNMEDATLIVNGTFTTASGHFYTTSGKANICGTESGGRIVFTAAPQSNTKTYQCTQSGTSVTAVAISITPAQLHNADGSYTATAGQAAGTVFTYCCGEWLKQDGCGDPYNVTWKNETGSSTYRTQTFYACEDPVYNGTAITKDNDAEYSNYVHDGWSATPSGDLLTTLPRETATYYAHFSKVPTVASVTASGNTTYYATLLEAFNYAKTQTTATITILRDIEETSTSLTYNKASGSCTLDLNGHTVSGACAKLLTINASGSIFTITDNSENKNGRLENVFTQNAVTYNITLTAGTLSLQDGVVHVENNGTYNNSNYTSIGARAIQQSAGTTLNIAGGKIECIAGRNAYGILQDGNATATTTLNMTGGEVYAEAPAYAYGVSAKGIFNFSAGTITARLNTGTVNSNTSDTNADRINHRYAYGIMMTGGASVTASSNYFSTLNMTGGKVYSYNDNIKTTTQLHIYGIYFNGSATNVAAGNTAADGTLSQKWSAKGSITNGEIYVENTGRTAYGVYVVGSYNSKDNKSHVVKISNTKITTYASYDAIGVYASASIGTTSSSSTRNLAAMYHADIELNNCEVKAETTSSVNAYAVQGISTSNTIYSDQTEYDTSTKKDIAQTRFTGEYATASKITINGGTYSAKSASYNAYSIYTGVRSISTYGTDTKVYANKTPGGNAKDSVTLIINGGTFNATSTTYGARGVCSGGNTTIKDATFNVVAGTDYAYGLYANSGKLTATNVLVNDTAKGRASSSDNNAYAYGVMADCAIPSGNTPQTGFAYAGEIELNNCTINAVSATYTNARGIMVNATSKLHNWAQFKADSTSNKWSTDNYNQYKQVFPCTQQGKDSVWVGIVAKATINGGTFNVTAHTTTAYGAYTNRALSYSYHKPNTILEEYHGELNINNATFDVKTETSTTAEGVRSYGQTTITGGSFDVTPATYTAYGIKAYAGKTTINGSPIFNVTAIKTVYGIMAGCEAPNNKTGILYNGEVEVNGGTFTVTATTAASAYGVYVYAGSTPITSTASGYYAGNYASAGTVTINGSPIFNVSSATTAAYGVWMNPTVSQSGASDYLAATATPICTIHGGSFTATSVTADAYGAYISNGATLTVTDGSFKGDLTKVAAGKFTAGVYVAAGGILSATGGTFTAEATNSTLTSAQKSYAAGLYAPDGASVISASNATFKGELKSTYLTNGGASEWSGGAYGFYARSTEPLSLTDCTIEANSAYQGGFGLRLANTPAEIRNCTISVTTTKAYNYGLFVGGASCDVKLYDCSFSCTSGTTYAYGIYAYNGVTYAEGCTINATTNRTGASSADNCRLYGINIASGKSATLKGCTINATGSGTYSNNGYGAYVDGTASIDDCTITVSNINSGAYALFNTSNTTLLNVTSGKYKATATTSAAATNGTAAAAKQTISGGYYSHETNLAKYAVSPKKVLTLRSSHALYPDGYHYTVGEGGTVTWKNGTTTLLTEDYIKGETPAYTGDTPTKTADEDYTYTFAGWDPTIGAVNSDMTYTATFTSTERILGDRLDIVDWSENGTNQSLTLNMNGYSSTNSGSNWKISVAGSEKKTKTHRETNRTLIFSGLTLTADEQIVIKAYDASDNVESRRKYRVPHIFTADATLSSTTGYNEQSIIYVRSGKLTLNTNLTVAKVIVCPGAELVVNSGKTLTCTDLVLRTEAYSAAILTDNGTITTTNCYYTRRVADKINTYPFGLPFNADISAGKVKLSNGVALTLGTHYGLMKYDGERRSEEGKSAENSNWTILPNTTTTLEANCGYQLVSSSAYYQEFYFPVTYQKTTAEREVNISFYSGAAGSGAAGWNYLVSPFTQRFTCSWDGVDPSDQLQITMLDNTNHNTYVQEPASTIEPAMPFFYQASEEQTKLQFTSNTLRLKAPARHQTISNTQWVQLFYSNNRTGLTDQTNVYINSEKFTEEYELNYDLEKLSKTGDRPLIWTTLSCGDLAFAAIPEQVAETRIPLTLFSPEAGNYTFYIAPNDFLNRLSHLYLFNAATNEQTDLLSDDYTAFLTKGKTEKRFYLQAVMKTTDIVTSVEAQSDNATRQKPRKILIDGCVYILMPNGETYNILGGKMNHNN